MSSVTISSMVIQKKHGFSNRRYVECRVRWYELLYNTEAGDVITNRDLLLPKEDNTQLDDGEILVLKKRYSNGHARYVRGIHFTKESISCPT